MKKRAADVLAYFAHPRTINGPTEVINGGLEHLSGSALGFRNLTKPHRQFSTGERRLQTSAIPSIRHLR